MHRITGDGYIVDGGKNRFADEDLPSRSATQVTHQFMNAVQEEIATVIEAQSGTLHADSETYAQMTQLNTAINTKIQVVLDILTGYNTIQTLACNAHDAMGSIDQNFTLSYLKRGRHIILYLPAVSVTGTFSGSDLYIKPQSGNFPSPLEPYIGGLQIACAVYNGLTTWSSQKMEAMLNIAAGNMWQFEVPITDLSIYPPIADGRTIFNWGWFIANTSNTKKGFPAQCLSYLSAT